MIDSDLADVRRRTRAAQHIASYPLLVMGVLFVNYGVVSFAGRPFEWRYAGAVAFVVLWGLGKVNETEIGVGPARGDFLAIAAGVFTATQLTLLDPFVRWLGFYRLQGVWVLIVGAGLLALGLARHERALAMWGSAVSAVGLVLAITNFSHWATISSNGNIVGLGPQSAPVAVLGVVLTAVGLLAYERERRVA